MKSKKIKRISDNRLFNELQCIQNERDIQVAFGDYNVLCKEIDDGGIVLTDKQQKIFDYIGDIVFMEFMEYHDDRD